MSMATGTRLGPFQILSPLGAGGMGEVYRASDSKLRREVALKLLPEAFARDEARMTRFSREAQVLAALNHPNIAAIYGLEESGGVRALVMELIEGPTLAERIGQGPLPVEEALSVARQIAEALEYAHEKGVVHRDVKPANIKLRHDGQVKVLDFGLAKALEGDQAKSDPAASPTLSLAATSAGVILGTAAYMSPEQAKGKTVDRRADIWAFGCVLCEMLTGRSTFQGETTTEVLAAVIMKEPDLSDLPRGLSPRIRQLLKRCLAKDAKQRLRDIGEARITIAEVLTQPESTSSDHQPAAGGGRAPLLRRSRFLPWAVAGIAIVACGSVWLRPAPRAGNSVVRFSLGLPEGSVAVSDNRVSVAISPDGQQLAFLANSGGGPQRIYTRRMDTTDAVPLAGTEEATGPFFSPDGQWIGFAANGKLKKVRFGGGNPVIVADAPDFRGGTWLADDSIVFSPGPATGLVRVVASGSPQTLTTVQASKNERTHRWPYALPGGKAVLFTVGAIDSTENYDNAEIDAVVIATGERKVVFRGARMARYLPGSGYLLLAREGSLSAVPFDPERLITRGNPVPALQGVQGERATGSSHFAVSDTGTMFFIPGTDRTAERLLVWLDPSGTPVPLAAPPRPYFEPALSPDGQRVAVAVDSGSSMDVWVYDLARKVLNRLTFGPNNSAPIWSADGRRVIYRKETTDGKIAIAWKPADGAGEEELLLAGDRPVFPTSASPDGKWLAVSLQEKGGPADVYMLSLAGDHKLQPFITGPYDESSASFSPDGRWVAYRSNESGRYEIYVKPFPDAKGRWQISAESGGEVRWSPTGKELIYRRENQYFAVPVQTAGTFQAGAARPFLRETFPRITALSGSVFSLSRDGKRVLITVSPKSEASGVRLEVTTNWAEEMLRAGTAQK
jgi:serine/threonine-protein kinase